MQYYLMDGNTFAIKGIVGSSRATAYTLELRSIWLNRDKTSGLQQL